MFRDSGARPASKACVVPRILRLLGCVVSFFACWGSGFLLLDISSVPQ